MSMSISKGALSKLAALAEDSRMKIVVFLASNKEPGSVGQIAQAVGLPFVNISHHLGILESAQLLSKEKAGRSVMVSLNDEIFNPSNKEDSCGYFAFDGFKLALPGLAITSLKAAAAKVAPKAEEKAEKKEKPAAKGKKVEKKEKPAPKPVEPDDDDDDDDE